MSVSPTPSHSSAVSCSAPFFLHSTRAKGDEEYGARGAMMQHQEPWNPAGLGLRPTKSAPCSPIKPAPKSMLRTHSDFFHVAHKVPVGDTPYVRAKRVQVRACVRFCG
jgi:hypothetical protein